MINGVGVLPQSGQGVLSAVLGQENPTLFGGQQQSSREVSDAKAADAKLKPSRFPNVEALQSVPGAMSVGFTLLYNTLDKMNQSADEDREGFGSLFEGLPGMLATFGRRALGFGSIALIAGGLVKGAMDGIMAAANADEWGTSKGAAFTAGFLTGNNRSWTDNALKWAAIGGGVGGIIGGPIGMIAGGLLGGAFGAIMHHMDTETLAQGIDELIPNILEWAADNAGLLSALGGGLLGLLKFKGPVGVFAGALIGMGVSRVFQGLADGQISLNPREIFSYILADTSMMALFGAGTGAAIGFKTGMIVGLGNPVAGIAGALIGAAVGAIAMTLISRNNDPVRQNLEEFDKAITDREREIQRVHQTETTLNRQQGLLSTLVQSGQGNSVGAMELRMEIQSLEAQMREYGHNSVREAIEAANEEFGRTLFTSGGRQGVEVNRDSVNLLREHLSEMAFNEALALRQSEEGVGRLVNAASEQLNMRMGRSVENFGNTILNMEDGIFSFESSLPRGSLFGPNGEGVSFDPSDELYLMASTNPARDKLNQAVEKLNERIELLATSIERYRPTTHNTTVGVERPAGPSMQDLLQR